MSDIFVGDNDHVDAVPPTDVLLEMIKTLREDVVHLANELNELKALYKHDESVAKSYQKIASKHHDTLQKLAQEEKTNG
jgi:sugar-specific transcriptional regulator TrmB